MKQQTLAMDADQTIENYRKPTRRDEFLKTMEVIVPWVALCSVIEPIAPKQATDAQPSVLSVCRVSISSVRVRRIPNLTVAE